MSRMPFLISWEMNSSLHTMRDVPTQTRIFIYVSRCLLIQHSRRIRKQRSSLRGFLHRPSRRLLPFRRLLRGCRGGLFSLEGSRRLLEAVAKRTDYAWHVLHDMPKQLAPSPGWLRHPFPWDPQPLATRHFVLGCAASV
jgi:hypothetical protein